LATVTVTPADGAVCPPVSVATALSVWLPSVTPVEFHATDQPSAPFVSVPMVVLSTRNRTWVTPWSSVALAWTVIVPDTVAPLAGAVIVTDGGLSTDCTATS
jgi:hypothetical protein